MIPAAFRRWLAPGDTERRGCAGLRAAARPLVVAAAAPESTRQLCGRHLTRDWSFTPGQGSPGYAVLVAGNASVAGWSESSQPLDDARKGMLLGWRIGGAIAALQSSQPAQPLRPELLDSLPLLIPAEGNFRLGFALDVGAVTTAAKTVPAARGLP